MTGRLSYLACAAIIGVFLSSPAAADVSNSNREAAQNMASTLSGTPGIGAAAPTVSGSGERGNSGWGNNGSDLVSGDKVSRGDERGNKSD
jgi:hypothetical protein